MSKYTKEVLEPLVLSNTSVVGILRELGLNASGGCHNLITKKIKEYGLDTSHFINGGRHYKNKPKPLPEVMVEHSTYNRSKLKTRLLRNGMLINKCAICGQQGTWNSKPLVMVLDHINGVHNDHRIENLRMLCPNCNSQQPTFAGRNRK